MPSRKHMHTINIMIIIIIISIVFNIIIINRIITGPGFGAFGLSCNNPAWGGLQEDHPRREIPEIPEIPEFPDNPGIPKLSRHPEIPEIP